MKDYLEHIFNPEDPDLVSVIDELPLWSAPFGLKLLDSIILYPNMNVLDVGCGSGFPLIEVAQRLGSSSKVFGIDPWVAAIDRVNQKIKTYKLKNVVAIRGFAENLLFEDNFFDLIVSNNGINNVENIFLTLSECYRVCKKGAQFVLTMNLDNSMIEFYRIFKEVLQHHNMNDEIAKMKEHIYSKRKPLEEMKASLAKAKFKINNIYEDKFSLKFLDASTMFNHYLIKYWFIDSWKNILKTEDQSYIFDELENELNQVTESKGEIEITIPFVTIDCQRR